MTLLYSDPITTEHIHLGDLINVIQCRLDRPCDFVGNYRCWCCGNELSEIVPFLLSVISCPMRYYEGNKAVANVVFPSWVENRRRQIKRIIPVYRKSDNLPPTGDHIVCSFGTRSRWKHLAKNTGKKSPKEIEDDHMFKVLAEFKGRKVYNLSDSKVPGTVDMTGASLAEKFVLVSSAYASLTTDNGIAHLSLLTNAKTIVVHNSSWKAHLFYPSKGVEFWHTEDL